MGDFSKGSKKRIAQTVKRLEHTPRNNVGLPSLRRPQSQWRKIWAKILGSTQVSGVYRHSWKEQIRDGDTWIDKPGGLSGTTTVNYAVASDASQIATDKVVEISLSFVGSDTFWTIHVGGGGMFRVLLENDGGAQGDLTNPATWTYTASDEAGTSIGFTLSPLWERAIGTCTPAGNGIGYFNSDGEFILLIAFEVRGKGDCS